MSRNILKKNISRLMAVLLTLTLLCALALPVLADGESGSCGSNLSWSLSAGTLTITGSGAMEDFPESTMAPWYALREEIYRLVLPEGLTAIGDLAFYECKNLTAVTIPGSVTSIGDYAFTGCSGMTVLNLGSGVQTIGEAAFSDCVSLTGLTLPGSLRSIGLKGFYRCESITTVTVPSSVTSLGTSAFSYCKSLIRADIQANISVIPEYLFYGCPMLTTVSFPDSANDMGNHTFRGCEQLNTVYYRGEKQTAEQIGEMIAKDLPSFGSGGSVTDQYLPDSSISGNMTSNTDGSITVESSNVVQGGSSTVTSTTTTVRPQDGTVSNADGKIDVTITGSEGWSEAKDTVEKELDNMQAAANDAANGGKVEVNIFVQGSDEINKEFIDAFAGRDVTITVTTQNGSTWTVNGANMTTPIEGADGDNPAGYNLQYEVTAGTPELCQELGVTQCYVLKFLAPAQINAEVMIRLSTGLAFQNATLMQRIKKDVSQIQTTVVDSDGYAHFYLAAVDDETEYYIAMNLPQPEEEPIIPEPLAPAYGNPEQITAVEYEITGKASSWGMNIQQVTWIMVAVLVGCVIIVGVLMFALNKRKLKAGYIPDLEDEDLEAM